jgi:hypothetical protein
VGNFLFSPNPLLLVLVKEKMLSFTFALQTLFLFVCKMTKKLSFQLYFHAYSCLGDFFDHLAILLIFTIISQYYCCTIISRYYFRMIISRYYRVIISPTPKTTVISQCWRYYRDFGNTEATSTILELRVNTYRKRLMSPVNS